MNGSTPWVTQVALGLVPIVVAWLAYRQAVRANQITAQQARQAAERSAQIERSKVDAEAFARAKLIYEGALEQLERQLERIQTQFDRLNEQLGRELDTSSVLRSQVNHLQQQVALLERTVADLRRQLVRAGIPEQTGFQEEGAG